MAARGASRLPGTPQSIPPRGIGHEHTTVFAPADGAGELAVRVELLDLPDPLAHPAAFPGGNALSAARMPTRSTVSADRSAGSRARRPRHRARGSESLRLPRQPGGEAVLRAFRIWISSRLHLPTRIDRLARPPG